MTSRLVDHILSVTRHWTSLDGTRSNLEVQPSDLIRSVKTQIQKLLGIPAAKQRLAHFGETLEDGQTLAYYNIQPGNTLNLYVSGQILLQFSQVLSFNNFYVSFRLILYSQNVKNKTLSISFQIKYLFIQLTSVRYQIANLIIQITFKC